MRGQVDQACRDLGRLLGEYRRAAGLSQVVLAGRIAYSRSTVATAENGSGRVAVEFWESCDRELAAGGALAVAYGRVRALTRALREQRDREGRRVRQERARRFLADSPVPLVPVDAAVGGLPGDQGVGVAFRAEAAVVVGCGCPLTVVRWSGWETRALREALRLTVGQFASRVRVRASSVTGWESLAVAGGLRPGTQRLLDDLLASMDVDGRARMRALLRDSCVDEGQSVRGQVVDRHECAASGPAGPDAARLHARSGRVRRGGPVLVHDGARGGGVRERKGGE
ncbi:helix-turn-helix domain-containing protein [Solwaraspora sp. WMMD1047]|uniref:helix-turn-helix domain-containing protein n=1 Tax=Solwaraspora sp. WMMD1047 TaxID=3016102 RepID=UPI002416AB1C|nr:helix-turn-helix domain-containing protein [Solwaraspora sp. WMMD1047]MDG4833978.1 helix-turn-helix domain-containing protein [Solwaraspora sp. WMMD1047]